MLSNIPSSSNDELNATLAKHPVQIHRLQSDARSDDERNATMVIPPLDIVCLRDGRYTPADSIRRAFPNVELVPGDDFESNEIFWQLHTINGLPIPLF